MYRGYVGVCVYIYIYISIGSESSVLGFGWEGYCLGSRGLLFLVSMRRIRRYRFYSSINPKLKP